MNATTTRLTLRLHRFELLGLGALIVIAAGLTVLVSGWLDASGFDAKCFRLLNGNESMMAGPVNAILAPGTASPDQATLACQAAQQAFFNVESNPLFGITQFLVMGIPFLLGIMAGIAVVGREIERGTTRLVWALAPSRMRWYLARMVPVLIVVIGLSLIAGVAGDRLAAATNPGTDVTHGFVGFGFRGMDLAARAVFGFAVAVLAGTAMGRVLPALLVAVVITYVGLAGGTEVENRIILQREAVVVAGESYDPASLQFDSGFMGPDGRFIGWAEMNVIDPPPTDSTVEWVPKYPRANLVVPGSRYPFVEAREALALAAGSLVALLIAGWLVRRARPG